MVIPCTEWLPCGQNFGCGHVGRNSKSDLQVTNLLSIWQSSNYRHTYHKNDTREREVECVWTNVGCARIKRGTERLKGTLAQKYSWRAICARIFSFTHTHYTTDYFSSPTLITIFLYPYSSQFFDHGYSCPLLGWLFSHYPRDTRSH